MKNLKKPTFDQKRAIARAGLDWRRYLVLNVKDDMLVIVDRDDESIREVKIR